MASDIVVVGAARTPIGAFGGSLRDVAVYDLGALAIRAAVERAGIEAKLVDQVIYGNCRQAGNGPNPARTASVRGGIPAAVPVFTVNMACPSAMKSVMLAARELAAGEARFVLAGGMESMSTMPYLLKGARWEGFKSGDKTLTDSWSDTVDPLCGFGMGMTAENLVQKYSLSREEQDAFAVESQRKAAAARAAGHFASEIVPVALEKSTFLQDEPIRAESSLEKLAKLRAVFKKDGTVTAGNACTMGDAACALVVTTRAHAAAHGVKPLFSIVASAEAAVEPATMGEGPGVSIPRALARADLALADMDAIEVNEAFAAQMLANERVLKWDRAKVNRFGGAIALGHPTGFSGGRLLITLDNVLRRTGDGGVTTAIVIRREQ